MVYIFCRGRERVFALDGRGGHLGRAEEAKASWAEALRVNPDYSLEHHRQILPYKDPRDFDRLVEGLRKAGLPD